VTADARADDFDLHAIGGQAAADQLHIAARAALAGLGNGVAEEGHFVARFHGNFGLYQVAGGDESGENRNGRLEFHGSWFRGGSEGRWRPEP